MQLAVVNRRAARKYTEFVGALETVWMVLEDTEKLINELPAGAVARGWRVPSREQLSALRKAALMHVEALQVRSRRFEAELVSRDWRV
jgi:hypothetical protein